MDESGAVTNELVPNILVTVDETGFVTVVALAELKFAKGFSVGKFLNPTDSTPIDNEDEPNGRIFVTVVDDTPTSGFEPVVVIRSGKEPTAPNNG